MAQKATAARLFHSPPPSSSGKKTIQPSFGHVEKDN
jgi:hypothetical protein